MDEPSARYDRPSAMNPLASQVPRWYHFYKRVKLLPWWVSYNRGMASEAILKDRIIELGAEMGMQDRWLKRILRHAVSEFSKNGLGADYYGYHNIDHELEAAYFSLLAANGQNGGSKFSYKDIIYIFVAALFHDYDPTKAFDKPNEDSIEQVIRSDAKICKFINEAGLNIDIVIAMIYRTAYPFTGENAEHATKRMHELFTEAGIPKDDVDTKKRYMDLGWFLSVSERIAGYALGDFERSKDLARRNAHALHWHSSVINERSVKYFSMLQGEKEMFDRVMQGVPQQYKQVFWNNVEAFGKAWNAELETKNSIKQSLRLVSVVERNGYDIEPYVRESIFEIYREQPVPVRIEEEIFKRSLSDMDLILITLRINDVDGKIVGYAKGGPLASYRLRRGTHDRNRSRNNTAYLEGVAIRQGYLGETGGHLLRLKFLNEAINRGYSFVTGYAHRDVILQRISRGEKIEIVQKYDPDRLDYYRANLSDPVYQVSAAGNSPITYIH